jgi:glycerophosphoryl diester phosphodiesterase
MANVTGRRTGSAPGFALPGRVARGKLRDVTPITFAHRGARIDHPENTLAAFSAALERGSGALETDAFLSADGQVVLVHDEVIGRGRRKCRVRATPAATLTEFGVPRLADLYSVLGTDFDLSVDAKHPEVTDPMLDVAADAGALERLWVCLDRREDVFALRPRTSARVVHSQRKDRLGVPIERHAYELGEAGIDAMNFHHREWTAGLVALFHRFDVRCFAWDAQEVRHIEALCAMGIDAIYCDRPERLVATVREFERRATGT